MMRKLVLMFLILMIFTACQNKKTDEKPKFANIKDRSKALAWGKRQHIYVFADDNVWKYAEKKLRNTIERTYFTTVNEKMFTLERITFNRLEDFFRFNNIIFYCDASADTPVSKYVKDRLGEKLDIELEENGAAMFPVFNLWADDQLVLFITGENEETLLKLNMLQAEEIWEIFKERLYKRLEYQLYRQGTKPRSNYRDKIWEVDLPKNFMEYQTDELGKFTSYIARSKSQPDRYFAVYYEESDTNILNRDWLISKRNEIIGNYYEGDKIAEDDVISQKYKIAGYKGIMLRGRWQNDKYAIGGAFNTFAFWTSLQNKVFIIDNSVYYPEGNKLCYLLELEIISNTFQLKQ